MKEIINLSTLHELTGIYQTVIPAFAELCQKYAPPSCYSCGFFGATTNYAWVVKQFLTHKAEIDRYKTGQISTEAFLNVLVRIFNFLTDSTIPFLDDDINNLFEQKESLSTLQNITGLEELHTNRELIARALLENAWNTIIGHVHIERLQVLARLTQSIDENPYDIYLISNTNELNIQKIMTQLRAAAPNIAWRYPREIDISVNHQIQPIEIAPHIYLCLSYQYGVYKNAQQQRNLIHSGTPGLVQQLKNTTLVDTPNDYVRLVSQFKGDVVQARALGITAALTADEFYSIYTQRSQLGATTTTSSL